MKRCMPCSSGPGLLRSASSAAALEGLLATTVWESPSKGRPLVALPAASAAARVYLFCAPLPLKEW